MTPKELVSNLRLLGVQDGCVVFAFVAEHYYELTLNSGTRLTHCDVTTHKQFWEEVSEAANVRDFSQSTSVQAPTGFSTSPKVTPRPPQPRWDRSCPDCGHEHEGRVVNGRQECGHYLGEEKFCPCESQVAV